MCFFSKDANRFWNSHAYGITQSWLDISVEDHQVELDLAHDLPSETYKYPKCRSFSKMPTNTGICNTFNGLDLHKIFKKSQEYF